MRFRMLIWSGVISAAVLSSAAPAAASTAQECIAGKPTAASYTWNFKHEADTIFENIQATAKRARLQADTLQSFDQDSQLSWDSHEAKLRELKNDINSIGARFCRLETIRRVVAPWQQKAIDRMAATVQLMADNDQDALNLLNANRQAYLLGSYQRYVNTLDTLSERLVRSADHDVKYARGTKDYRDLGHNLGMSASS
jgi:hypothetical protein